jgi:hypothetical protein
VRFAYKFRPDDSVYVSFENYDSRHPLPLVIGPTVSEYYEVIRLPAIDVYVLAVRLVERPLFSTGLTLTDGHLIKALTGSPKFLTLLFLHATPFDPGRPLGFLP